MYEHVLAVVIPVCSHYTSKPAPTRSVVLPFKLAIISDIYVTSSMDPTLNSMHFTSENDLTILKKKLN